MCLSVPAFLGFRGVGVPDCVVAISSVHLIRSVLRAVPLPALVRVFELIKTAHGVNSSGTTSETKNGPPHAHEERPEKRNEI